MESHEVLFLMVLALVVGYPLILFLCSFVFASKSCETSTKDDKHLISVCKDEGTLNLIRKRSKQRKRKKSFTSASTSALERQPKVSLSQPHKVSRSLALYACSLHSHYVFDDRLIPFLKL